MATLEEIVAKARNKLRDHPRYFSETVVGNGVSSTHELPQTYVVEPSIFVSTIAATPSQIPAAGFTIDARNGIIRFQAPLGAGTAAMVEGYHYEWFLDSDLALAAENIIAQHGYRMEDWALSAIPAAETQVIVMGTIVEALWSLLMEVVRDINVTTPDGAMVHAGERYYKIVDLLTKFEQEYKDMAAAMNLGIHRIEMFELWRVSLTTGRLVPKYLPREIDDTHPPERVYHDADSMDMTP